MIWEKINTNLKRSVYEQSFWEGYISKFNKSKVMCSIHLGIFVNPYLKHILEGKKTVESRFSINRIAPYKSVNTGDIILLKKSGGPVIGVSFAASAWYYELDKNAWKEIKENFSKQLCITGDKFWKSKSSACYASLIQLEKTIQIEPFKVNKKDRRGWVVIRDQKKINF